MAEPARIKYEFWLTFSAGGAVRSTKGSPSVARNERAMRLVTYLPKSLFTEPTMQATITVDHTDSVPAAVNLELAATALRGVLGVDIDIRLAEPSA